jgi:signal transduction histidine kinase
VAVSIEQRAAGADPAIATSARTIAEVSNGVYATVRGMMHRLRPVVLDELGLTPALEQLIDDWNGRHVDTFCAFAAEGDCAGLDDAVEISVYRIVQEALTNVARHAQAQRVEIALAHRGESLALRIRDDGCGFDPASAPRGLGLLGMQERVAALGGGFDLRSRPGAGVTIDIRIPLPAG